MRNEIYTLKNNHKIKLEIEQVNLLRNKGLTLQDACLTTNITVEHYRYIMKKLNKNEIKKESVSKNEIINPESKSNLKPKLKRNSKRQIGGQNENSNLDSSNIKSPPSDDLFENPILAPNSEKTISKPKEQPTPKPKPKPKPKPQAKPKPKPQAQAKPKPKPKPKPEPEPQLKSSIIEIGGGNNKSYMTDNSSIDSLDTLSDSNDSNSSPPPKPKAKPKPKPKAQPKPESKTTNEQKNQTGGNKSIDDFNMLLNFNLNPDNSLPLSSFEAVERETLEELERLKKTKISNKKK